MNDLPRLERHADETVEAYKARRLRRFAIAFRDQAISLDADGWPNVADAMLADAIKAERAAGTIELNAMNSGTIQ